MRLFRTKRLGRSNGAIWHFFYRNHKDTLLLTMRVGPRPVSAQSFSRKRYTMSSPKVLSFKTPFGAGPMPKPHAVISVGRNGEVLRLREGLLSSRGRPVQSLTPEQAETEAHSADPHVWIFCSSVELFQIVYLACSIRRYSPESRLLLFEDLRLAGFEGALFHKVLKSADGPNALLTALDEMAFAS
jgi:hypothetical protein